MRFVTVTIFTVTMLSQAFLSSADSPTFRLAALEYNGRIGPDPNIDANSSDEKWKVMVEGIDFVLKAQESAGTPVDIIVTSELPTFVSSGDGEICQAQYVPGPRTDTIAALAVAHNCWIIVNPAEKDPDYDSNDILYNSTLVFNRKGRLVVNYHKVRLPKEQSRFTPGTHPVVVETEFGRMAVMNCFEISAEYGNADYVAEVMSLHPYFIVHPTWGYFGDETVKISRDNNVYIASSVWDGSSRVIGPDGVLDEQFYDAHPSVPAKMKVAVADVPIHKNEEK
ncbi:MAG: carbon-nitrogen hydrolase family protein [Candidatus Latescibacteria bacterium]|nr:carbon-nitrogen hydrolase family protein [Candidatus Latescibacterota bacterium]